MTKCKVTCIISLFFLEKKSEIWNAFTLFENWKVNLVFLSLISRMKSEMKMHRDRDVKCSKNSREFSRNETLAGYWKHPMMYNSDCKLQFYWTSTDIEIMINRATLPRGIAPHCRSRLGPGECFCPEKVLNSSFCWATTLHLGGDNTQDFCQTYR